MTIEIHKRDLMALARIAGDVDKTDFVRYGAVAAQRAGGKNSPLLLTACNGRSAAAIPCVGSMPGALAIPHHHAVAGARLAAKDGVLRVDLESSEKGEPHMVHIHRDGESLRAVYAKQADVPDFVELEKKAGGAKSK